jgi:methylase of polypeptide subunit release factors
MGSVVVIELDIMGKIASIADADARRLRAAAAAEAGRSAGHRDLSLLLDRALETHRRIALQRGEQRALDAILKTQEFADLRLETKDGEDTRPC